MYVPVFSPMEIIFGEMLTAGQTIFAIQSNPLNGSPYNGPIRLIVQDLANPILKCSLSKSLSDNGSIRFLVQFLAGHNVEPLSGSDCSMFRKSDEDCKSHLLYLHTLIPKSLNDDFL